MKDLFNHADEIPATLLIAIAYVTLGFLTDPFSPTEAQLAAWGWLVPMDVARGDAWRLLTYSFLHGGILHLGLNLMFLLSLGPALERTMGTLRFVLLYAFSACGGGIAVCLLYEPTAPVVGGSGALFGMMGSLVAWNMRAGRHLFAFLEFEGPRRLLSLIAVNLLIGLLIPVVSNTGHVGGLVAGFALTFLWLAPSRETSAARRHWQAAVLALFASAAFASVRPVWRWDCILHEIEQASGERRLALERALVRSLVGEEAGERVPADVARDYVEEVRTLVEALRQRRRG